SVEYIVGLLRDAGESESTAFRVFAASCFRAARELLRPRPDPANGRTRGAGSLLYLACPTLCREVSAISAPWGREAATFRKRGRHPCLSKRSMIYTSLRRC